MLVGGSTEHVDPCIVRKEDAYTRGNLSISLSVTGLVRVVKGLVSILHYVGNE